MSNFNEISDATLLPGTFIEIDPSQAGLGSDLPLVLLVGQKLSTGTAVSGEIVRVASVKDAETKAGVGSMLAQMAKAYRSIDTVFDLFMLPYSDNAAGTYATGTITVNTVATASGTLPLYVSNRSVPVGVTVGQTTAQIATAIAAAINANTDVPATAAAVGAVVTLTARHKGSCGNNIDLRYGIFGETMPAGLGLSTVAMTGGTGDPLPGDLASILGRSRWFKYVAIGMNDAATLAAWHTETQRRYKANVGKGFRAFNAFRGDFAQSAAYLETKNYEHIATTLLHINPTPTWEAAASSCAAAAPKLYNNPVRSLENTPLPGLVTLDYFDDTDANSLLFKGGSLLKYTMDGSTSFMRVNTMYKYKPDGSNDDAYRDIHTVETMERIRYYQRYFSAQEFAATVSAKTDEGYQPGLPITTEDRVKGFLLGLYKNFLMKELGWVQEYAYYANTLIVRQNETNPSRFDFFDKPIINSPFYTLAGRSQFAKRKPVTNS